MKKILFPFCIAFFLFIHANGQTYKYLYFFDKDFQSVDESNAVIIGKGLKDSTLFLIDCYDKKTGRLSISAHFSDSLLSNFEGPYKEYYSSGQVKQEGDYKNGERQGEWYGWDSTGLQTVSVLYEKGKEISLTDFFYHKGKLSSKSIKDIMGVEKMLVMFDEKGNVIKEDKVFSRVEMEPIFLDSKSTFQEYIMRNINRDVPTLRGAPDGRYLVMINFVIDAIGNVTKISHESVNGYGMEEEAIRVIKNSPLWTPAMQNGNNVSFRMKQIVPFQVRRF